MKEANHENKSRPDTQDSRGKVRNPQSRDNGGSETKAGPQGQTPENDIQNPNEPAVNPNPTTDTEFSTEFNPENPQAERTNQQSENDK
jgi:hypothetical protein